MLSNVETVSLTMDTRKANWSVNANIIQDEWVHVTVTWSECFGLSYYENGEVKEHAGIFDKKASVGSASSGSSGTVANTLYIGKSPFAQGALFSMSELVIWRGQLSPADIELLSRKGKCRHR